MISRKSGPAQGRTEGLGRAGGPAQARGKSAAVKRIIIMTGEG
jgi:hypothetical protein